MFSTENGRYNVFSDIIIHLTIMTRFTQIGIVSAGEDCFNPDDPAFEALLKHPGIYTRVSEFKHWIIKHAPGSMQSDC